MSFLVSRPVPLNKRIKTKPLNCHENLTRIGVENNFCEQLRRSRSSSRNSSDRPTCTTLRNYSSTATTTARPTLVGASRYRTIEYPSPPTSPPCAQTPNPIIFSDQTLLSYRLSRSCPCSPDNSTLVPLLTGTVNLRRCPLERHSRRGRGFDAIRIVLSGLLHR